MSILDQNLLTLDFWQDTVTYGGHTLPAGSIGCAALNIPDETIATLTQLCMPLTMIVLMIDNGTMKADGFSVAENNLLEIAKILKATAPFSHIDYPADGHDIHTIFAKDRIDIALAYMAAAQQEGAAAALKDEYKYGVGLIKLIQTMSQIGATLQLYKHSMTAFAEALHDSGRTPDDYAAAFAQHFPNALELSPENTAWMSLTNVTMQYVSDTMKGKDTPQLVKQLHYVSFVGMFRSDLFEGLTVGHAPRKCPICGKWFLTTDARQTKYCGGLAPGDKLGRTCRQIGNLQGRALRELADDHPIKAIYTRRMNTITQYLHRGTLVEQTAKEMKRLAKDKLKKATKFAAYANGNYAKEMEHDALLKETQSNMR